jgi:hypothetical protein
MPTASRMRLGLGLGLGTGALPVTLCDDATLDAPHTKEHASAMSF